MLVTRAVGALLAAGVDDLVPQAGGFRADGAFGAIEAELVNDQQAELGVEANAVVDGLVGQRSREIFEQLAAGEVTDTLFEHARRQADALDQPAFPQAGLADEDDVLLAANEVALSQGFDLQAGDGRIEVPVEGAQGQGFAEAGLLDEALDAALPAQAGLIGEQPMEELQVRAAGVLGLFQGLVELARRSPERARSRSRRGSGHAGSERLSSSGWSGFSADGGSSVSSAESKCW